MVFCSFTFLLFFMPAVLLGCRFLPVRAKRVFLLLASLVFYGWGMPAWLALLRRLARSSIGSNVPLN